MTSRTTTSSHHWRVIDLWAQRGLWWYPATYLRGVVGHQGQITPNSGRRVMLCLALEGTYPPRLCTGYVQWRSTWAPGGTCSGEQASKNNPWASFQEQSLGKLPRTILEGLANKEHSFKLVEERSFYVGSNFLRKILGASTNISYMSLPISVICHQQQPSKKDPWGISHATRKGSSGLVAREEQSIWLGG